jgi:asparagine synthetase B (glutamine-hydrolysing)
MRPRTGGCRLIRNHVIGRVVGWLPVDDRYQSLEWKLRRFTKRWDDDMVTRPPALDVQRSTCPIWARAIPAAKGMAPAALAAPLPETDDALQRILALDFSTYMPGSVLTKVDRASMAHGLEVRPPLLDDGLVERAFALPSRYKVRGGSGKYLLKLAARGRFPDEIIDRPKKGFGIPLAELAARPAQDRIQQVVAARRSSPASWTRRLPAWNQSHQTSGPITASRCGRSSC